MEFWLGCRYFGDASPGVVGPYRDTARPIWVAAYALKSSCWISKLRGGEHVILEDSHLRGCLAGSQIYSCSTPLDYGSSVESFSFRATAFFPTHPLLYIHS